MSPHSIEQLTKHAAVNNVCSLMSLNKLSWIREEEAVLKPLWELGITPQPHTIFQSSKEGVEQWLGLFRFSITQGESSCV